MERVVDLSIDGGVAKITLNRPKSLNSLNKEMAEGLQATLHGLEQHEDIRCVVIRGAGDHFMAGGDIRYFQASQQLPEIELKQEIAAVIEMVNEITRALRRLPSPVIASVRGSVAGFGMSLVTGCDMAIASENASFTQAYSQIATTPDGGNTFFLPRQIGMKRAMALSLLNEPLDAKAALEMGLVNKVVTDEALESETDAWARRVLKSSATAMAGIKNLLNASFESSLEQQLALEKESFVACALGDDFREGIAAFVEKRRPRFE